MTVEDAQERLTAREFIEWQLAWEREPFGLESWQIAQYTALFYAANRGKRGKKLKALDFMPGGTREPKRQKQGMIKGFHNFVSNLFGKPKLRTEDD